MGPTVANPIGGYTDPNASPGFQAWLRQQLLDQAISAQAMQATSRLPASQPVVVPGQASDQGMLPPPNQPAVAAPPPAAAQPPVAPVAPTPAPAQATPPDGSLPIEQPARGATVPGSGANGFDMASTPAEVKQMFVGPPKSPEEVQARHSAWSDFIDQIKADPNMPSLLLKFGTSMMQPIAPGQTPAGHLGQALQGSVDYLAAKKMQEAELAKTQAQTGKIGAETTTEQQQPGKVAAETGAITAGTARTEAETATLNSQREGLAQKLQAEVDRMQKEGNLNDQQAALLAAKTKTHPAEVASEIALRKAHEFYFTHPEMHARANANALESARMQSVRALADAFVHGGDDALTVEYQKNPSTAMNKAIVQAQAGQVGQFWKNQEEESQAEDSYKLFSSLYDEEAKAGKLPKGMTRQKYILNQLITSGFPTTVNAKIAARAGKEGSSNPAATPTKGGRPPLDSFQQ